MQWSYQKKKKRKHCFRRIAKAARELGIGAQLIHRWKKEQQEFEHSSFPGHGTAKLTDEQREIARLKKELRDAKMEAEILKKAIGIFSTNDSKNLGSWSNTN